MTKCQLLLNTEIPKWYQTHFCNDGSSRELMSLTGTVPMYYGSSMCNIPICVMAVAGHINCSTLLSPLVQWSLKQKAGGSKWEDLPSISTWTPTVKIFEAYLGHSCGIWRTFSVFSILFIVPEWDHQSLVCQACQVESVHPSVLTNPSAYPGYPYPPAVHTLTSSQYPAQAPRRWGNQWGHYPST